MVTWYANIIESPVQTPLTTKVFHSLRTHRTSYFSTFVLMPITRTIKPATTMTNFATMMMGMTMARG